MKQPEGTRSSLSFAVAGPEDDDDIRRLLRENAVGGAISISLEREPTAYHGDPTIRSRTFVVARDKSTGTAVAVCERVTREVYINGRIAKLPYLAALRVAPKHRNRISLLRGGFAALKKMTPRTTSATAPKIMARGNKKTVTRQIPLITVV